MLLAERERRRRERERAASAPVVKIAPPDALAWARMYRRIDNKPFSLARYKPLEQIYRDTHPSIVIRKPALKGLSDYAVTRACHKLDVGANYYDLDKAGLNVGYIFSTKDALSSFSKERFSDLRLKSDKLSSLFTVYDAVGFKQAGESYLYFAGGKSVQAMKSFAADDLILDEFDEIPPNIVALAEVRLNESDLTHQLRLSTPTVLGKGIDAEYLRSDQNVWEVRRGHCGDWNELDFYRDVRADGGHYDTWKGWDEEPDDADKSQERAANVVRLTRTTAMDAVYNRLARAVERWPALIHNDPEVVSHMKAPVRVPVKNKDGVVEPRWVHTTPDDCFHTSVYDFCAQNTLPRTTFVGILSYTGEDD